MKLKTVIGVLLGILALTTAGAIALMAVRGGAQRPLEAQLPKLRVVTDFSLTEAGGRGVRRQDLRGKVWIASFIFTRCATQCPLMMREEVQLQTELPVRDDLRLVTFSVDPVFDTPQVLTDYATTFGADRRRWLFLTGDRQPIWQLAQQGFGLTTGEAPGAEMPILHSTKLVLVDRQSVVRGYYDSTDVKARQQLLDDVKRVLAEKS